MNISILNQLRILRRRAQWTSQPIESKKVQPLLGETSVVYQNHSIDMHWIANDLTSFYMIQVSIKKNFRIDCIL